MAVKDDVEKLRENYICWLYSKVGKDDRKYDHFWRVIRKLHQKDFYVIVPNDDNRYIDGTSLRRDFFDEFQYPMELYDLAFDFPCTVLEMLVAFAMRIDSDIMWDPDIGDQSAFWFWKMLENAGLNLKTYSDENFNADGMLALSKMIDRVLTRRYDRNGNGSFFPIKNPKRNYAKTELWHQMQLWIAENYPI